MSDPIEDQSKADHLRTLIASLGRLVPTYWPNESFTTDFVIDWKTGRLTRPVLPKGKSLFDLVVSGEPFDLSGGEELTPAEYAEHMAHVVRLAGDIMKGLAALYERHRPTEETTDPHDTTIKTQIQDGLGMTQVDVVPALDGRYIMLQVYGQPQATSATLYWRDGGFQVTVTDNINAATLSEREDARATADAAVDDGGEAAQEGRAGAPDA
jgi:hypothetical protein